MLQGNTKSAPVEAPIKNGKTVDWGRIESALKHVKVIANSVARVVQVTPTLAAQWIKLNRSNRPLRKRSVETFARDMRAGRWLPNTSDAVMIGRNGVLLNGQHRLSAVIESGKTVEMLVEFGADPGSVSAIDRGIGRSALDSYLMNTGKSKHPLWGGVARATVQGASGNYPKLTTQEFETFFDAHETAIDYATDVIIPARKGIRRAAVAAVFARANGRVDQRKLDEFAEVLVTGIAPNKGHGIILTLRDWLLSHPSQGGGVSPHVVYRKSARALIAYVNGERLKTLYEISEEPFPFPGENKDTKLRMKRSKERRRSR